MTKTALLAAVARFGSVDVVWLQPESGRFACVSTAEPGGVTIELLWSRR